MKYGNINLKVMPGTLSILISKEQETRHYPGTDNSDVINKGRLPTKIKCQIKVSSKEESLLIQQTLHESSEKELYFDNVFYKKVVAGQEGEDSPISLLKDKRIINAEFIALDPVPYDIETGEVKY